MKFKLTIGDTVEFPVKGQINDGAKLVPISLKLQAKRLDTASYREALSEGSEVKTADFLATNVTGWTGQQIVQNEDGSPADFGPEAFAALLSIVGMEALILGAYVTALQVSETPKGRAGN